VRLDYEFVHATGEGLAPRTVAIYDAVGERRTRQVVILGAGLDGRAWRLQTLAGVAVYEVDPAASQDDKRDRAAAAGLSLVAGSLAYVPVDFSRDRLTDRLAASGHRTGEPTTWIWEGVVPYLTRAEVAATLASVASASARGSRLVVQYQAPSIVATVGKVVVRAVNKAARRVDVWATEPRRSAWRPTGLSRLLASGGFEVGRDDDLLTIARGLGVAATRGRSLAAGRVLVADLD
jgi:methyltransferase (TIGR00027 family)